jgi:hypothetical protein
MTDEWYEARTRASREPASDDEQIEVRQCIVCMAPDLNVVFSHQHVEGRRVAIPARVGLCSPCVALIKAQDLTALAQRARAETWGDFDESDFFDTAQDLGRDLAPYNSRP